MIQFRCLLLFELLNFTIKSHLNTKFRVNKSEKMLEASVIIVEFQFSVVLFSYWSTRILFTMLNLSAIRTWSAKRSKVFNFQAQCSNPQLLLSLYMFRIFFLFQAQLLYTNCHLFIN